MTGSPSAIITLGYGNGTFDGEPSLILSLGYGAGDAVPDSIVFYLDRELEVNRTLVAKLPRRGNAST